MKLKSRLNPIEQFSYRKAYKRKDQNYPNLMKIGINLQDDRITLRSQVLKSERFLDERVKNKLLKYKNLKFRLQNIFK